MTKRERGPRGPQGRRGPEGRRAIFGTRANDLMGPVMTGFIIGFALNVVVLYVLLFTIEDHSRDGCERLDLVRQIEWVVLTDAAVGLRADAADAEDPELVKSLEDRAAAYEADVDKLEASAAPFLADDPIILETASGPVPSPVDIDCAKAYPYPAPFG